MSGTLRERLRERTAEHHARLDAAPVQRSLLAAGLSLDGYAAILQRYMHAHGVLEPRLLALEVARPPGLPPFRPRLAALRQDLATLTTMGTRAPTVPNLEALSALDALDPLDSTDKSLGRYLGLRYVLDGATQGAKGISRRLEVTMPDLWQRGAVAYWRAQHEAALDWPALLDQLATPQPDVVTTAALLEAVAAFQRFELAFEGVAP